MALVDPGTEIASRDGRRLATVPPAAMRRFLAAAILGAGVSYLAATRAADGTTWARGGSGLPCWGDPQRVAGEAPGTECMPMLETPDAAGATAAALPAVDKSGGRVRGMFAEIAPRYDLVNRLLSGGIDVLWRRTTVRRAPPPVGGAILDVCTGTGDLALAYAATAGPGVRIVASDFCRPMLDRGAEKSRRAGRAIEWVEADAMQLPFPAATFDLVTVAFGLRNIADTARGLSEMARVCRPGGTLAILEFSLPSNRVVRGFYLWYFRRVLPAVGNAVARNASDAYSYLNRSVEEFPAGEALAALVRASGFDRVEIVPLTLGIATLYVCHRGA